MKKKAKYYCTLVVGALSILSLFTQQVSAQEKRYLIAEYVTNPISPILVETLKKQVPDKDQYNEIMNQLSNHSYYFQLIYDTKSNQSIYKLDSLNRVKDVNAAGNFEFVIRESDGSILGKENFVQNVHYFEGNAKELNWEITSETRKIGNYDCTKAIFKNLREYAVWFTTEIPVMSGPEIFSGLPGLVLQVESVFDQTTLRSLKFVDSSQDFESAFEKAKFEADKSKKLALNKVFESKNNMATMIINQVKSTK